MPVWRAPIGLKGDTPSEPSKSNPIRRAGFDSSSAHLNLAFTRPNHTLPVAEFWKRYDAGEFKKK